MRQKEQLSPHQEQKMEQDISGALNSQGMRGRDDVIRFIKWVDSTCSDFGKLTSEQIDTMSFEEKHEIWLQYIDTYNRLQSQKRRQAVRASKNHFTIHDIRQLWIDSDGRCSYCSQKLERGHWRIDHVVALSKGGSNGADNIVLACERCNLSKGSKTLSEWYAAKQ